MSSPQTQPAAGVVLKPKFGDLVENGWASENNPTRRGFFVREFRRSGRLNPGLTWEITDGKGKFWDFKPSDIAEEGRLTVTPATPASGAAEAALLPAEVLADRERFAFAVAQHVALIVPLEVEWPVVRNAARTFVAALTSSPKTETA